MNHPFSHESNVKLNAITKNQFQLHFQLVIELLFRNTYNVQMIYIKRIVKPNIYITETILARNY